MTLGTTLKGWARRIKRDGVTLWFACKSPQTPWYAKALGAFVVAYALSPIDLIPDFIPVLGYVDWAAAGSVDTDLSFLSFLELYRTDVAQRRMAPGRVVEPLDVIEDVSTSLLPGPVYLPSRSLCLQ